MTTLPFQILPYCMISNKCIQVMYRYRYQPQLVLNLFLTFAPKKKQPLRVVFLHNMLPKKISVKLLVYSTAITIIGFDQFDHALIFICVLSDLKEISRQRRACWLWVGHFGLGAVANVLGFLRELFKQNMLYSQF